MKRPTIISLSLLLLLFACKKAKGPADGNSVQPNNNIDSTVAVSAVINGANWHTDSAIGYSIKYSGNDSGVANLMITATNKTATSVTTIAFNITNYTGPKQYRVNPPVNTAAYYVGNNRHFASAGIIVVSADTAYALRGTFNFMADTFVVTSGVFDVALP